MASVQSSYGPQDLVVNCVFDFKDDFAAFHSRDRPHDVVASFLPAPRGRMETRWDTGEADLIHSGRKGRFLSGGRV